MSYEEIQVPEELSRSVQRPVGVAPRKDPLPIPERLSLAGGL